jgi:hypothetical protein
MQQQLFRPFLVRTIDGATLRIHHPRLAQLTSNNLIVDTPDPLLPPPAAEASTLISLESIVGMGHLDAVAST